MITIVVSFAIENIGGLSLPSCSVSRTFESSSLLLLSSSPSRVALSLSPKLVVLSPSSSSSGLSGPLGSKTLSVEFLSCELCEDSGGESARARFCAGMTKP